MGWRRTFTPYLLSGLILALTLVAWFFTISSIALHNDARFETVADEVRDAVVGRLQTYQNLLLETRGLFHAAPSLSRQQFRTYVEDLRLLEFYPGMIGLGFSRRVTPAEVSRFEASVRREGHPDYRIWPAGPRDDYFAIDYLEPGRPVNMRAFGYDMFTEARRRHAMEEARDTGLPVATPFVKLVQGAEQGGEAPGFLIYVPVYAGGTVPASVEARRRNLLGFVYSPFRAAELFRAVFPPDSNEGVSFRIGIQDYEGGEKEIFAFREREGAGENLARSFEFTIAGRPWVVTVLPTREFLRANSRALPNVIFAAGALFALLSFWLLKSQLLYSVAEKQRNRELALLNRVGRRISSQLDLDKLVQGITDAGRELSGAAFGAFFYTKEISGGEKLVLYTLSGAEREAFANFPMPRATGVFAPTFHGEAPVRSDDITKDPRYGKNAPYAGLPDGHLPVKSYLAVPVRSASDQVLGGLFFGHPLPGRFSAREEQLIVGLAAQAAVAMDNAQLYKDAQEAVQARDEFLRIASHELKTPLTPLKLHMQGLSRDLKAGRDLDPARLQKIADTADQQIGRLNRLVEDLLDVSRISAGLLRLSPEAGDLRDVISDVMDRNRAQIAAAGMPLKVDAPDPIPANFDHLRLEQVLANLITNAVKYAPGAALEVSLRRENGGAELAVADRGPGISADDAERVFQRFERVGGAKISGLGLGLFITRQIVEAHGGSISVEENPGGGARFVVRLPLAATA